MVSGVCRWCSNCSNEQKRNEKNDKSYGKICKKQKTVFGKKVRIKQKMNGNEKEKIKNKWEFKYLGYALNSSMKRTNKKVVKRNKLNIGKCENFKRRMMMFDSLVKSIVMNEAEVWGWKEYEEIDRGQEKYIKWLLVETGKRAVRKKNQRTTTILSCN